MATHKKKSKSFIDTLPKRILSTEGKQIVREDPDLSYATIKELIKIQPPTHEVNLQDTNNSNKISLLVVSFCIDENPNATLSELVGRYAQIKKMPYIDAVLEVMRYSKNQKFQYYRLDKITGNFTKILWEPVSSSILPPKKEGL